jgi:hypothetical protein
MAADYLKKSQMVVTTSMLVTVSTDLKSVETVSPVGSMDERMDSY